MVHPVTQTVRMALVNLADGNVNLEAIVDFLLSALGSVDDADGKNIIDFLKCHVLVLHLIPNGIRAFHTCLELILEAHLVKFLTDGGSELLKKRVTLRLRGG